MDQNNWFFYGIPDSNEPVYGLYEPVHDTFFLVHTNLDSIKKLVLLFSSRFTLHVCKLSDAHNYHVGIIDNTVCKNWSLSNKEGFPITRFPDIDRVITPAELIQTDSPAPWNFVHDQLYMMAACYWLEREVPMLESLHINHNEVLTRIGGYNINKTIGQLPGMPFKDKYLQAIESIESIIYTEFNLKTAEQAVAKILKACYV